MSETQDYEYSANPNGGTECFFLDKDGKWKGIRFNHETKRWIKAEGHGLRLGFREKYHDFSF